MSVSKPTFVPGVSAGTGATASVDGEDAMGQITLNVGTLPVLDDDIGAAFFGAAFSEAPSAIILTPANSNAALRSSNVWIPKTSITKDGFDLKNVGVALTANLTYVWYYQVLR